MPRIKQMPQQTIGIRHPRLLSELAEELRNSRESGQPLIIERDFSAGGPRSITVVWDKWADVPFEERAVIIQSAYRDVEGQSLVERRSVVDGLTFPEAYEAGMFGFQVVPILRKSDRVTADQCADAMIAEGASLLFIAGKPQLRFPTREDAQACVNRLEERLPGSDEVWAIAEEIAQMHPRIFD